MTALHTIRFNGAALNCAGKGRGRGRGRAFHYMLQWGRAKRSEKSMLMHHDSSLQWGRAELRGKG